MSKTSVGSCTYRSGSDMVPESNFIFCSVSAIALLYALSLLRRPAGVSRASAVSNGGGIGLGLRSERLGLLVPRSLSVRLMCNE